MPVLEISVLTKEKASKKKMRKYARKADRFYMTDNVKVVIIYFFNDRQSHQEFLRNGNSFHGLYVRGRESKKDSFDYFRLGYVKLPVGTPIPIRPF